MYQNLTPELCLEFSRAGHDIIVDVAKAVFSYSGPEVWNKRVRRLMWLGKLIVAKNLRYMINPP